MAASVPVPLVVEPSGQWLGVDGSWSSFGLDIGTPPQTFLTLPAIASNVNWIPLPEGCFNLSQIVPGCGASRGVETSSGPESSGFNTNASSTWNQLGLFSLPVDQSLFEQDQNGLYGLESVRIGNSQSPRVPDQIVAGVSSADLWVGTFGLNAQPAQFIELGQNASSLLSSLKNAEVIPSLSFGYTAGASYSESCLQSDPII